jgi:hypothetical protein
MLNERGQLPERETGKGVNQVEFRLTITIGNDAMRTYKDLRAALRYVSSYTAKYRGPDEVLEPNDNAFIRDENGNQIGEWEIDPGCDDATN